jgi:hypothetical protein
MIARNPSAQEDGVSLAEQYEKELQGEVTENKKQSDKPANEFIDDASKIYAEKGIGAASKQFLEDIKAHKEDLNSYYKQGKWGALASAGFAMAEAATNNPHGGFLGAFAVGGATGAKKFMEATEDYRKAKWDLTAHEYTARQNQENLSAEQIKLGYGESDKAKARTEALTARLDTAKGRVVSSLIGRESAEQQRLASIEAAKAYRTLPWQSVMLNKAIEQNPNASVRELSNMLPFTGTATSNITRSKISAWRDELNKLIGTPSVLRKPDDENRIQLLQNLIANAGNEDMDEGTGAATSQYQEGSTATGPKGQKIIFRGGKWVPA